MEAELTSRCTEKPPSILHSRLLPLSYPLGRRVSSVSGHPSNQWERPKQAWWEFRVLGLGVWVLGFKV